MPILPEPKDCDKYHAAPKPANGNENLSEIQCHIGAMNEGKHRIRQFDATIQRQSAKQQDNAGTLNHVSILQSKVD